MLTEDIEQPGIDILRIDHVGIMVSDVDEAASWYTRALSGELTDRWEDAAAEMAWAHVQAGPIRIEFVQRPALAAGRPGTAGLHHIALVVTDCSSTTEALEGLGGTIVIPPSYFDRHAIDWSFVRDPFGNILEIVSYRDTTPDPHLPEHQGGASRR